MKRHLKFRQCIALVMLCAIVVGCGPAEEKVTQDPGANAPGAPKISNEDLAAMRANITAARKDR